MLKCRVIDRADKHFYAYPVLVVIALSKIVCKYYFVGRCDGLLW